MFLLLVITIHSLGGTHNFDYNLANSVGLVENIVPASPATANSQYTVAKFGWKEGTSQDINAGIGVRVEFTSNLVSGTSAGVDLPVAYIGTEKVNGTDSDASSNLVFGTRPNNSTDPLPRLLVTSSGDVSATNVIYASGGNSNLWNSVYSNVQSASANWQSTYTTVSTTSAIWTQSLSFNETTKDLSISSSNTVSLTSLEILAEIVRAKVVNVDTVPLTAGMVVYTFGATGDTMSVKRASNASEATSSKTLGFVDVNTIPVGGTGYVVIAGQVTKLHLQDYTPGDLLWLGSEPGTFTAVKPVAPNHMVIVGYVEYAHAIQGKIYVKIDNGYELDELHNVHITTPAKGDMLEYNGTIWVNSGIVYTIELIDTLTVDFYAPYDMKINTVTNIKNSPTTTIQDDGVAYTLTNTILLGSKVTVTVNTAGVVNLNITKA